MRAFCERVRKQRALDPSDAVEVAFNKFKPEQVPAWAPIVDLQDVPFVCLRIPTGGGKTLVAAHGLGVIYDELLQHRDETGLVLWLTPSDTIRTQTLEALSDERHPYRRVINAHFRDPNKPVQVLDNQRALTVRCADVEHGLTIVVSTMAALKRQNSEGLRAYQDRAPLYEHFSREEQEDETLDKSLVEVIRRQRPLIILDEGHNDKTELALEVVRRFNPSFVLELTATPHNFSNVLVRVSAQALKSEQMVKLPVRLESNPSWEETLRLAVERRGELEKLAQQEKQKTGEYIRPILLIQAERDTADPEKLHVALLKQHLMEVQGIPEQQIAIKTGTVNEIAGVDLLAEYCPVRFILTRDALREGWDCPFAYVLASVYKTSARLPIEQLLGRVLRLPNARSKQIAELNKSYVYVSTPEFEKALQLVLAGMQSHGFERGDIQRPDAQDVITLEARLNNLSFPLLAIRDGGGARQLDYRQDVLGTRLDFLDAPLDVKDLGEARGRSAEIDVDEQARSGFAVRDHDEGATAAAYCPDEDEETVKGDLVTWLLSKLPNLNEVAQADLLDWTNRLVNAGIDNYGLEGVLSRKFQLADRARELFDDYYLKMARKGFDVLLNEARLTYSNDVVYGLPQQEVISDLQGSFSYKRSLFERVDNLNNEERTLADALDSLAGIAWWHRNTDKGGFALKGWHPHSFNPDFLAHLANGVDVLLEYKGEDRATDESSKWKAELGHIWQSLENNARYFKMVTRVSMDATLEELRRLSTVKQS